MSENMKVMINDEVIELSKEKTEEIKSAINTELANDEAVINAAQKAKNDLLDKLGITADEAKLLLA